jgi:predicted DNA-binding ribbon-helix-helix protein
MKSSIVKRSVVIGGHKTSISLEEPFWTALKQIAHAQHVTTSELVTQIDDTREQRGGLGNLHRLISGISA